MPPSFVDAVFSPVRFLGGMVVATLPRRIWNDWEGRVPVRACGAPAALLPVFLSFAIGIPAFLAFAQGMGSTIGGAVLEASEQIAMGKKPADAGVYTWYGMMFTLPAFLFATPTGWLCLYLGASGAMRLLAWAADDARGDPLLTGVDALARGWYGRTRERWAQDARNAREGDERPDLLVRGHDLGMNDAVYLVVSSRLKPGWDPGVFLLTEEGRFRVGTREDRQFPEGLRAVYPLGEVAALEITRRGVSYTLPALSGFDSATRRFQPPLAADPSRDG